MIIGFTGRRPQYIGGYDIPNPTYNYIITNTKDLLLKLKPEYCISGGALGFDTWCAELCIELDIPYVLAIPHDGQELIWPQQSKEKYKYLLSKSKENVIVSKGKYASWKMHFRNEYIVDNSDVIIACIDPDTKSGGTYSCVQYANSKNKTVYYVNPNKNIHVPIDKKDAD